MPSGRRTLPILLVVLPLLPAAWLLWQWELRETVEATIVKLMLILPGLL